MTQRVSESRERVVCLLTDRWWRWWQPNATENTFTGLSWEINPVSGGNVVTYGRGGVLSTLAVTVLLVRGRSRAEDDAVD
ncbi:hypothetical protein Zmor_002739 [Zophobas morio]|uniref:Uncharacterized protein n=1 Tax=Zophobas morio TaxID=2755281 RepID=A0AA38HKJ3_9CUCU|nr:hypothetical protein Zmor_002739 [Zophobas morio]